ncbi:putative ATP-grasp-modified RiPP [Kitasatospora sp. NPDC058032]|uniref:putative ATP-grasp-modified RiPP n=1 Tax=Kitasatospora sp. NPDC058032 TaxID=3346307 RepID=UPI0036D7979F
MATAPWGTTRMGPFTATVPVPKYLPTIDPETQVAVFVDEHGRTIEMGGHGTSTSGLTPTATTPDGNPGAPTDADTSESYDQDQSDS